MSGAAIGYVYEFSPFKGATFSVHLAIGDVVNDAHGWEFYMSVVNLSKKARVNRKTAGLALDALESAGFLECLETADPVRLRTLGRSLKYRFLRPPVAVAFDGGVRRDTAPSRDQGVRRDTAPGEASDRAGVRRDTARTKERTEGERKPSSKPAADPADQPVALVLVGDPEPTVNQRAKSISDRYWSWWKNAHGGEEPLTPFLAVKARVKECIVAGWPDAETVKALARCEGTITRAALQRARQAFPAKSGPEAWDNSLRSADAGVGFVQREPGKSRKLTPDEIRKVQGLDESGVGHG